MKKLMITAVITAGLFFTKCSADENHKSQDTTTKEIVKQNKVAVENTAKTENAEKKPTWQKAKEFDQEHNVTEKTKAAITAVKQKTKEIIAKVTGPNPETLYKKCAGCHGDKAQNNAFGKSKVIHNFTTKQISTALHGYQNRTYGGEMKTIMYAQTKKLSDEDISALANYIPTLK